MSRSRRKSGDRRHAAATKAAGGSPLANGTLHAWESPARRSRASRDRQVMKFRDWVIVPGGVEPEEAMKKIGKPI
jgi:hypothetical protein